MAFRGLLAQPSGRGKAERVRSRATAMPTGCDPAAWRLCRRGAVPPRCRLGGTPEDDREASLKPRRGLGITVREGRRALIGSREVRNAGQNPSRRRGSLPDRRRRGQDRRQPWVEHAVRRRGPAPSCPSAAARTRSETSPREPASFEFGSNTLRSRGGFRRLRDVGEGAYSNIGPDSVALGIGGAAITLVEFDPSSLAMG